MTSKTESDIEALSDELGSLREQIAKVAQRFGDTATHAGEDVAGMSRRAWSAVQDEAEPFIRGFGDHPILGTAFLCGALGLLLGLLFARRL